MGIGEKEKNVHVLEPKGKRVLAVSFRHPILVDRKGHSRPITKSLGIEVGKDFEKANKIANDIKKIINNKEYCGSYDGFLKSRKECCEEAVDIVFEKTDFMSKYNNKLKDEILENNISLRVMNETTFKEKAVQLVGLPGAGKTVFTRQVIGSSEYSFPATTQSNTTIGSFESYISNNSKELKCVSTFFSKAFIKEYVKGNLYNSIIRVLTYDDESNKEDHQESEKSDNDENLSFEAKIYIDLTQSEDRKSKFNFLFGDAINKDGFLDESCLDENCKDVIRIIENIKELSYFSWQKFYENNEDAKVKYVENEDAEIKEKYYDFITKEDKDCKEIFESIIKELFKMVQVKVKEIINSMIEKLNQLGEGIESELLITGKNIKNKSGQIKYINKEGLDKIELEKILWIDYISFKIHYKDKENHKPDRELRNKFFEILQHLSSGSEKFRGRTLFPLISGIRIKGNFRPLWIDEEDDFNNFILLDSEGIGHDVANKDISCEMRMNLLHVDQIFWILNATNRMGSDDKDLLKYLIISGYLNKTKLCFNRLEQLDKESNATLSNKISYIEKGFDNLLNSLIEEEKDNSDKIITGKQENYKKMLSNKSILFEHLDKIIDDKMHICEDKEKDEELKKQIEILKEIPSSEKTMEFIKRLREENNILIKDTVNRFDNLIKDIKLRKDIKARKDGIDRFRFEPIYKYEKFVYSSSAANDSFRKEFLRKLQASDWQTVKAFNRRIAEDFDGRSWKGLYPEYLLENIIKTKLLSFLSNPEKLKKQGDGLLFDESILYIMESMSMDIIQNVKKVVVDDNKEEWEYCANLREKGSTSVRLSRIENMINDKFCVNYDKKKKDNILMFLKGILFNNEYLFKKLKAEIRM